MKPQHPKDFTFNEIKLQPYTATKVPQKKRTSSEPENLAEKMRLTFGPGYYVIIAAYTTQETSQTLG